MSKTKRNKKMKPRNFVVLGMIINTRNERFQDKKKQASKKACRGKVGALPYQEPL
jgi:hypothetical protein